MDIVDTLTDPLNVAGALAAMAAGPASEVTIGARVGLVVGR